MAMKDSEHRVMKIRKVTNYIVIHCSATVPTADIGVKEIDEYHRKVLGWQAIGYHYVIRRDGRVEIGRHRDLVGAHVAGHNSESLGICLIGGINEKQKPEANFTKAQDAELKRLLADLHPFYPKADVLGHRDFPGVRKACPSFDVRHWLKTGEMK